MQAFIHVIWEGAMLKIIMEEKSINVLKDSNSENLNYFGLAFTTQTRKNLAAMSVNSVGNCRYLIMNAWK